MAIKNLQRIRPGFANDAGHVHLEIEGYEMAIADSLKMGQMGWLDLFSKRYLGRTIVRCTSCLAELR
jgi:hypothetical protein